jgi:uncharacterized protein YbaR (Trm112 family)
MFIELVEYLRCPRPHEDTFLVLSTGAMKHRHVLFGTIGCPVCHAEFPVVDGIARFGQRPSWPAAGPSLPDADAVHALLGLESPGGYVLLAGSAANLAEDLGPRLDGVHLVCLNPPGTLPMVGWRSVLHAAEVIPLRNAVIRGVVLGAESLAAPWTEEAARVLLQGQRLVALAEAIPAPGGVATMAVGRGMWVGKKTR